MSPSIAVFGVGPGLGQAVARRYAREGYDVVLVARRQEPLDLLAEQLTSAGATAHVIAADLSDTGATPRLAERIRAEAGGLDAFYYAPTPSTGFVPAAELTPQRAEYFMPLILYTMLALVQEFLPPMLAQGDGAILTAHGGSTVQGLPNMSGPSPVFAASTPMSEKTASSCSRTKSAGNSWIAVTPSVFCAVSATITDIP
jgi:short-subunit dehydrogenase